MPLDPIWDKKLDDIAPTFSSLIDKLKSATFKELLDSGWLSLYGKVWGFTDTTNKTVVWLSQDGTGRLPFVEQNSTKVHYNVNNIPVNQRIKNVGGDVDNGTYILQCTLINSLLGAGGTLAAAELLPAVAATKIFPEEIYLEADLATANISAVGGNSANVTIDNSGGAILAVLNLSHQKPWSQSKLTGSPTTGENIRITVAAGIAGHIGASRIRGYMLYREIPI